jgi:hypothetical protein
LKKQTNKANPEPEILAPEDPPPEVPQMEPQTDPKPKKRALHPNSLKNLKRDAGPGRSHGSRNKFSRDAIERFVAQYRNDLAADWSKHGEAFVAKCRELYPQIYATMQRMRIEDELSRVQTDSGPIQVTWLQTDQAEQAPPIAPAPPLQIEYKRPELPCDMTTQDWSVMLQVLEAIKRVIPSNSDSPPSEVFEVIRKALLAHYAEPPVKGSLVLPKRGKSGR